MLQVQRSHKGKSSADTKGDDVWKEPHTVPGPEEVSPESQQPFPVPSPFLTNASARGKNIIYLNDSNSYRCQKGS